MAPREPGLIAVREGALGYCRIWANTTLAQGLQDAQPAVGALIVEKDNVRAAPPMTSGRATCARMWHQQQGRAGAEKQSAGHRVRGGNKVGGALELRPASG